MGIQVLSAALQLTGTNAAANAAGNALEGAIDTRFSDLLASQLQPAVLDLVLAEQARDGKGQNKGDEAGKDLAALLKNETANEVAPEDLSNAALNLPWLPSAPALQASPGYLAPTPLERLAAQTGSVDDGRNAKGEQALARALETRAANIATAATDLDPAADRTAKLPATAAAAAFEAAANRTVPVLPSQAEGGKGLAQAAANIADSAPSSPAPHALHTAPGQQARTESAPTTVSTPLHDNRWATDFGQKVVWIARAEQQNAQININPPQLGPIQISIKLDGDTAAATFASPHSEVRQALEAALPRLREMLADAGIQLGHTNVGSQFNQQQNAQENRQGASDSARAAVDNAILPGQSGVTAGTTAIPQRGEGLVDLFA
mgnify:CR=1 FL=1